MTQDKAGLQRKLLIVDDSKVSRMRIHAFFAAHCPEWKVEEASSGDEALVMAAQARRFSRHYVRRSEDVVRYHAIIP